jgi:hypothetical protein
MLHSYIDPTTLICRHLDPEGGNDDTSSETSVIFFVSALCDNKKTLKFYQIN